jgi:alcohol dehydrogenase class IV
MEVGPAPWSCEFATAGRIVFGDGVFARAGQEAASFGRRVLVVHGNSGRGMPRLRQLLEAAGLEHRSFAVGGEPDIELILRGVAAAKACGADLIIGFGGGSAMDSAKAVAALAANPGAPLDYLEVVGKGRPLDLPPLPTIAIPTTAGTGSEATRNAVINVHEHRVKVSLRHPAMLPRVALVDPALTWDLPPDQTAASGLDALTQLIEAFVCNAPNPLVDALCRDGLARAARSIRAAWVSACDRSRDNRDSPETMSPQTEAEASARRDMAMAALLSGMALANARLGVVHGLAGPLGGFLNAPHGALCAAILPAAFEENLQEAYLDRKRPDLAERFDEIGRLFTGRREADARDAVAWLADTVRELEIPGLGHWGLKPKEYPLVLPLARRSGSMQGNPVTLSEAALERILERSL